MTKLKYKTLEIRGTLYKTLLTKKFENRKFWQQPNENKVFSFIPGTALKIYVKPGDEVKEGDNLFSFEAMKMENEVMVPHDGIIKSVHVKVGEKFPKGIVLFEYK